MQELSFFRKAVSWGVEVIVALREHARGFSYVVV